MNNVNPVTGVPYGIIACHNLDPGILDTLLYGPQVVDLTLKDAWAEEELRQRREHDDLWKDHPAPPAFELDERYFDPQIDEPVVAGVYEGVHYQTGWLGGCRLLWVFESPQTRWVYPTSPCIPGAGDLDSPVTTTATRDAMEAYDVPAHWRAEED